METNRGVCRLRTSLARELTPMAMCLRPAVIAAAEVVRTQGNPQK